MPATADVMGASGGVGGRVNALQIIVDPIACDAHGLCGEPLAELITLDERGYPIIGGGPVPAHLERLARRTVAACPTLALGLERASG